MLLLSPSDLLFLLIILCLSASLSLLLYLCLFFFKIISNLLLLFAPNLCLSLCATPPPPSLFPHVSPWENIFKPVYPLSACSQLRHVILDVLYYL